MFYIISVTKINQYYVFNDAAIVYDQTIIFRNYLRGKSYNEFLRKAYSWACGDMWLKKATETENPEYLLKSGETTALKSVCVCLHARVCEEEVGWPNNLLF